LKSIGKLADSNAEEEEEEEEQVKESLKSSWVSGNWEWRTSGRGERWGSKEREKRKKAIKRRDGNEANSECKWTGRRRGRGGRGALEDNANSRQQDEPSRKCKQVGGLSEREEEKVDCTTKEASSNGSDRERESVMQGMNGSRWRRITASSIRKKKRRKWLESNQSERGEKDKKTGMSWTKEERERERERGNDGRGTNYVGIGENGVWTLQKASFRDENGRQVLMRERLCQRSLAKSTNKGRKEGGEPTDGMPITQLITI
jgi:hypothetical protein